MDKRILITTDDLIFATGVFLRPVKCIINGQEQCRWVAAEFIDDSYFNGETVNPIEYADKLENILEKFDLD